MLLKLGYADGLICGLSGQYSHHLGVIQNIIGKRNGVKTMAGDELPPGCPGLFDVHLRHARQ